MVIPPAAAAISFQPSAFLNTFVNSETRRLEIRSIRSKNPLTVFCFPLEIRSIRSKNLDGLPINHT
jgi:hypothetical protein